MRVCPNCRSEFVDSMTRCKACDTDLVAPDELEALDADADDPRALLADAEKAALAVRGLDSARELERILLDGDIPCYVHAEEMDSGAVMGPGSLSYSVVISQDDVERVKARLESMQRGVLATEGLEELADHVVDLEAEEVSCPACGHTGPLDDEGACADCGLVLGVG
jgi:hypothetical protein